ncbi:FkbM family methyltransferase [Gaiella sp.]|jgi:FkbM family methyltransferase|uniref:FkbM family methyltransferase n=1 Tax=Gaiella sp. TaxID=2663207 RepID=UPI002E3491AA|nr:FkbM family methyltransferase [Gaiella sp.]HEX5585623.1 FkbM family methyltransferase [Gaiella sp.]
MAMAHKVQQALASVGIVAHRRNRLRFGHDLILDIQRLVGDVSVIVDVGANEGQSAMPFARGFGGARVFAFEPVPDTFELLRAHTESEPRITCFDLALGAQEGEATILLSDSSGHNSLLRSAEPGPGAVTVRVTTGDAWAAAHGVDRIDVLKIDTEGYELEVLAGFEGLVAAGRVGCVVGECEFDRVTAEPHTSFFALYDYLTSRGMGFVTLYTDALASNRFAWGNALFALAGADAQAPANGAPRPQA